MHEYFEISRMLFDYIHKLGRRLKIRQKKRQGVKYIVRLVKTGEYEKVLRYTLYPPIHFLNIKKYF